MMNRMVLVRARFKSLKFTARNIIIYQPGDDENPGGNEHELEIGLPVFKRNAVIACGQIDRHKSLVYFSDPYFFPVHKSLPTWIVILEENK